MQGEVQRCQHSLEAQQSDLEEVNQRLEEHKSAEIEYKVHVIHACTGNSVQFWKCGVHFEPISIDPWLYFFFMCVYMCNNY